MQLTIRKPECVETVNGKNVTVNSHIRVFIDTDPDGKLGTDGKNVTKRYEFN